jgi:hypothetical protein
LTGYAVTPFANSAESGGSAVMSVNAKPHPGDLPTLGVPIGSGGSVSVGRLHPGGFGGNRRGTDDMKERVTP